MSEVERIAKEHADWASEFFKWVYIQAFVHGYKHGKESEKKRGGGEKRVK